MNPDTYTFAGDAVTVLGLVGVISTAIIIVTAFTRYYNSPLRKWSMMTKAQILKVIKTTAVPHVLTREEKFQVFVNVCDNMLHEGRITLKQHDRWTNVF